MILSRRVSLGGVQLDEIDESIVIQSIDPGVPHESVTAVNRMGGAGQRMTGQHWESLEVTVTYGINLPKRKLAERRAVFDKVNAWANQTGWLRVTWLPGKRLYVDKTVLASSGDLWRWTDEHQLTFRAYNVPFWQDEAASTVRRSNASTGSLVLGIGGNVRSVLDVLFKNTSNDTLTSFSITAGGSTITLTGISVASGGTLTIDHGTDGLLRIMSGSTSLYSKYSGSDDLYVDPGEVAVSFTADKTGLLMIQNYGRYI